MSLPHEQSDESLVTPVQQAGFESGATDPRSNAMTYRSNSVASQQLINSTGGSRKYKGGSGTLVVPQFNTPGPTVSAGSQTATSNSQSVNTTSTQSDAYGNCDSCIGANSATDHCQSAACNPAAVQSGGNSCGSDWASNGLVPLNKMASSCLSGGKRKYKKSKNSTKSRKPKKTKKYKKTKKPKKSRKSKKNKKTKKSRK